MTLDPINPVKFFALMLVSGLFISLRPWRGTLQVRHLWGLKNLPILLILFSIFWTSLSLIRNSYSLDERIFGIYGRNLGALTYLALFLILFSIYFTQFRNLDRFFYILINTGIIVNVYFLIQEWGFDPFEWDEVPGGIVSSTLGNPNFVSSHIAILSLISIAILFLSRNITSKIKLWNFFSLLLSVYVIIKSDSIQGIVILCVGTLFIFLTWSKKYLPRVSNVLMRFGVLSLIPTLSIITLLVSSGTLSPWGGQTMIARRDYWNSAFNMILESPIFGTGFDTFGDFYLMFRDIVSAERGMGFLSNSPHNLLLELGNSAGLPLLVAYLAIQILASRSASAVLKVFESPYDLALVVSWVGFNLQSLINPSNIATLTLGFTLTAILLTRREVIDPVIDSKEKKSKKGHKLKNKGLKWLSFSLTYLTAIIVVYSSQVPLNKDRKFRTALEQGDGAAAIAIVEQWPFNYEFARITAVTLRSSNFPQYAEETVNMMTKVNPNNIDGWRLMFEISNDQQLRSEALDQLRRRDPLNRGLSDLIP